jgi:hypothetical protein
MRDDRRRARAVSRREAWISALVIFAVAIAVRAVAAAAVSYPISENTAYYTGVARSLIEGRGLISDALWSYQTQPLVVPRAAFEVWMPMPSLLAAIPMAIAGTANWFRSAQAASVLVSALIPVMAWRLGADLAAEMQLPTGRARTLAVGSGLVTAFLGPLVVYAAMPDSTAPFAALSLAACLLMTRIAAREGAREGAGEGGRGRGRLSELPRRSLIGLGLILGLGALTRSEAVWLGLAWAAVVWWWVPGSRSRRLTLIALPALVAGLVFTPWAIRNALEFGSPLPGQTISNALLANGNDIFAYGDKPTLAGYLGQGPATLIGQHIGGFVHDLLRVLVLPAFPIGILGLVSLYWAGRRRTLRPLVVTALLTFTATSALFPVATTQGTYLHAAGATHVLLAICGLVGLDAFIARVGTIRRWTRPVAWLGPALAVATVAPLCFVSVGSVARLADETRLAYEELPAAMAAAGVPLDGSGPVITDNPIWLAESERITTLALPQESPTSVLALARRFGSRLLIIREGGDRWPSILGEGDPASVCFQEVTLTDNSGRKVEEGWPLAQIHVFRIACR